MRPMENTTNSENLENLFAQLWEDYTDLNPAAKEILRLLTLRGETLENDHIALRTFDDPKVNIEKLASSFVKMGYLAKGEYKFPDKKISARHFEHPNGKWPKVFISQLQVSAFSKEFQKLIKAMLAEVSPETTAQWDFCVYGRPWKMAFENYEILRKESEFAAWLAAFGFRANHFTVLINNLKKFDSLASLNTLIKNSGYALNTVGGEIKGSPAVYLEQSSTLAQPVSVRFGEGNFKVPACYYEFAKRYPMPDGKLFQGFIAESANSIFESTDNRRKSKERRGKPRRN